MLFIWRVHKKRKQSFVKMFLLKFHHEGTKRAHCGYWTKYCANISKARLFFGKRDPQNHLFCKPVTELNPRTLCFKTWLQHMKIPDAWIHIRILLQHPLSLFMLMGVESSPTHEGSASCHKLTLILTNSLLNYNILLSFHNGWQAASEILACSPNWAHDTFSRKIIEKC